MLYFMILLLILQLYQIYLLYKIRDKIKENVNKVVLQIEEKPLQRKTRLTKNTKTRKNIKVEKEGK